MLVFGWFLIAGIEYLHVSKNEFTIHQKMSLVKFEYTDRLTDWFFIDWFFIDWLIYLFIDLELIDWFMMNIIHTWLLI